MGKLTFPSPPYCVFSSPLNSLSPPPPHCLFLPLPHCLSGILLNFQCFLPPPPFIFYHCPSSFLFHISKLSVSLFRFCRLATQAFFGPFFCNMSNNYFSLLLFSVFLLLQDSFTFSLLTGFNTTAIILLFLSFYLRLHLSLQNLL